MNITKILNKTSTFLIDPHNEDHSPLVKGLAWVTTIVVGIVLLGTAQGLSALWRWQSHIEKNDTQNLIAKKFQETFGKEKDTSALSQIWIVKNPLFDPTNDKAAKQLSPSSDSSSSTVSQERNEEVIVSKTDGGEAGDSRSKTDPEGDEAGSEASSESESDSSDSIAKYCRQLYNRSNRNAESSSFF